MLIRYLKPITLKRIIPTKQKNGTYIDDYEEIGKYNVSMQELQSEVDAQIYGADINKMLRLKSPNYELENFLYSKLNNTDDNISKYIIFDNNSKYKIKAVSLFKVDVERL